MSRHVGINVPLFSLRSTQSWGIGELGDLAPFLGWLERAGIDRLLLLPLGTMPRGETSPYSAASTLGIDPIYVSMDDVPDFARGGGIEALSARARAAIDEARASRGVRHDLVIEAKTEALTIAFRSFLAEEWSQLTPRGSALAAFIAREREWLDDYALYQAIDGAHGRVGWRAWPAALRDRAPAAIDDARRQLARELLEHQYGQWIADTQWQAARQRARACGVGLVGDLPFVAGMNSPEIWAHADEFRLDVSVGVPPDAFSPTGQDWGLPMYRWDVIASRDFAWLRQRAARMAALYDGLRVDHVIGVYRTYGRAPGVEPFFSPPDEPSQIAQGEAVMSVLAASGLDLVAEDLGVVPDFLRPSLDRLGLPGCRVLRWERDWHAPGAPFLDPRTFPARGAVMTGTHDTEPLADWWRQLEPADRSALLALDELARAGAADGDWTPALRDAFVRLAYQAGADELYLPVQDVFGWTDRVNVPGTVGPENWTWLLPKPVNQLAHDPESLERASFLRRLASETLRGAGVRVNSESA